ncbi:MAG: glycosyl hydrolase [Dehalococcoidia bacterium]
MVPRALAAAAFVFAIVLAGSSLPAYAQWPAPRQVQSPFRFEVTRSQTSVSQIIANLRSSGCVVDTLGLRSSGSWLRYDRDDPASGSALATVVPAGTRYFARCDLTGGPQPPVTTPTPTATQAPTTTPSPVVTPTPAPPRTPTATPPPVGTPTPAPTRTPTATPTPVVTSTPAPTRTPAATPTPVVTSTPASGPSAQLPTWGIFDDGSGNTTTVSDVSNALGRTPGVVGWYVQAASTWPAGTVDGPRWEDNAPRVRSTLAAGQAPMITWEMWKDATPGDNPMPLTAISQGYFDSYFDSWAAGVKSVSPGIVYLRIFHEMNLTGQYPWSVYPGDRFHNTPAQLNAAWRQIVDRFRAAGVTNVRWVFNTGGDLTNNPLVAGAYPGDAYVDYIGLDSYDTSPPDSLALDYPLLGAIANKPWMFGEVGGTPRWVTDELSPFLHRRPMTVVWFNEGQWQLESTRLNALKGALAGLP